MGYKYTIKYWDGGDFKFYDSTRWFFYAIVLLFRAKRKHQYPQMIIQF